MGRSWFRFWGWTFAVVGLVGAVLYALFFDVWVVPTDDPMLTASIQPTLGAGDVLVVTRHGAIGRGQLVRCDDPQAPGRFVVARAIAYSGDHLGLTGEVVTIDGKRTPSPHVCDHPTASVRDPSTGEDLALSCSVEEYGSTDFEALRSTTRPEPPVSVTVDPGLWYLVSDDRHLHVDSRDYGLIDPRSCRHIVFRVVGGAGFGDADARLSLIW